LQSSKEDALNYSNPAQGFALVAKTIKDGKVTEWTFGEAGGLKIHICSSSEYSSESRIPIINNPDEKTIYLVPASYQPSNNMFTEWVYINNVWEVFGSIAVDLSGYLTDVQINGTSIVSNNIANIPIASSPTPGVVRASPAFGIGIRSDGYLAISPSGATATKNGNADYLPITSSRQHESVFYGLAKIAGHDEKDSTLPAGQYTS